MLLLSHSMEEQYADVPVVGLLLDEFRTQASARADAADIQVPAHSTMLRPAAGIWCCIEATQSG